ncbi:RepB family plasmid replication initiator protein [Hymenobacter sp. HMF4947]|uniref:RepB family plasmid replication initiator protein n=1 Tax=Hymenobacter ginkgonis TaxID=2682976 RepID=A0A7K1TKE0_9BACT|nr:replication initiation protein [Hymenobacter ginkgonis]MVN78880.1 RepB family plasmid replication initiator protein [Hymenobacter ginkgonis]
MEEPDKIVAQHNALINARFSFLPLQMRLFLALLARIEFEDADFKEHFVPVSELVFDRRGGSAYEQVDEMCEKLTQFTLYIEDLEDGTRRRRKKPNYQYLPLMSKAEYRGDLGGVLAIFNPLIMPYLLQLRQSGNFTTAALAQLRKLKSPYSLRIYWLLKEYADFGRRTMSVDQLRFVLNIAEHEYPRFSSLKARVLDKAQDELAGTDLPFTFELERESQVVKRIKFLLHLTEGATKKTLTAENNAPDDNPADWGTSLQQVGVSKRSITQIARQLEIGEYDLGYVDFVLTRIQRQHSLGKVKKLAGAIYKALIEKYLLEEYLESQKQAEPKKKLLLASVVAEPEIAFSMSEVRDIYDNPGPFLKNRRQGETFAQHIEQVYLADGFVVELRAGEEWLIKK